MPLVVGNGALGLIIRWHYESVFLRSQAALTVGGRLLVCVVSGGRLGGVVPSTPHIPPPPPTITTYNHPTHISLPGDSVLAHVGGG